jgi:hypothetical protein
VPPTPVVAAYVPTYANYTPYVSSTEVFNWPVGADVSQLVVGGNTPQNAAALTEILLEASGEADSIAKKVLASTLDVQAGEYRVRRDGTIWVPVDYAPVVSVNNVAIGCAAGQLTAMTDLSGVWPGRKVVRIPVPTFPAVNFNVRNTPAIARPGSVFAEVTYVNGWAHTVLAAQAGVGTSQVTPVNVLGIVPGLTLTLRDGPNTEVVTVAPTYVMGSAVVPLTAPLANTHAAGATLSAMPPAVKLAVINLAKWIVKSRGSKAVVMDAVQPGPSMRPKKTQTSDPGGDPDYQAAKRTLIRLKRAR